MHINFAIVEIVGSCIELFGIFVIVLGLVLSTFVYLIGLFSGKNRKKLYVQARYNLGRAILLGLEILIAGDIIKTVTGTPTLVSVISLGIIVLIRVVLSFTLTTEIDGRWPWQGKTE